MPTPALAAHNGASASDSLSLLSFKLADQEYGLPVTSVVRIIEMVAITQLPGAPEPIAGIINLQGKTVPVMDLRQRFGLPFNPYGLHTPIILADLDDGQHILGLIVDEVQTVRAIESAKLEIAETIMPDELAKPLAAQAAYLVGVAKVDRQIILVLNARALLDTTQRKHLQKTLADQTLSPQQAQ